MKQEEIDIDLDLCCIVCISQLGNLQYEYGRVDGASQ